MGSIAMSARLAMLLLVPLLSTLLSGCGSAPMGFYSVKAGTQGMECNSDSTESYGAYSDNWDMSKCGNICAGDASCSAFAYAANVDLGSAKCQIFSGEVSEVESAYALYHCYRKVTTAMLTATLNKSIVAMIAVACVLCVCQCVVIVHFNGRFNESQKSRPLLSDACPDTTGQELQDLMRRMEAAEAKLQSSAGAQAAATSLETDGAAASP